MDPASAPQVTELPAGVERRRPVRRWPRSGFRDQALKALAEFDGRKAKVVEMKFFGGLTAEEMAAVLNVSKQTVDRDWSLAKAWLIHEMKHQGNHGPAALGKD